MAHQHKSITFQTASPCPHPARPTQTYTGNWHSVCAVLRELIVVSIPLWRWIKQLDQIRADVKTKGVWFVTSTSCWMHIPSILYETEWRWSPYVYFGYCWQGMSIFVWLVTLKQRMCDLWSILQVFLNGNLDQGFWSRSSFLVLALLRVRFSDIEWRLEHSHEALLCDLALDAHAEKESQSHKVRYGSNPAPQFIHTWKGDVKCNWGQQSSQACLKNKDVYPPHRMLNVTPIVKCLDGWTSLTCAILVCSSWWSDVNNTTRAVEVLLNARWIEMYM